MIEAGSKKRCAIYTRKSSEEGLHQEFNSLDAQREACEAYVKSQAHEGWSHLDAHYDDGGFSGGSMERPGLAALLSDIARGKIDVVVVYKIDRLTRSLPDFARMVELFDKHEVSFVSVTQAFNTTNSMGRLTLNVLLSFAQFEREVTGERIRDKIAASKAKGMWMGGNLPLGYDRPNEGSRILKVNENEAASVRLIFTRYLELGSVHLLRDWLTDQHITPKQWTADSGRKMGAASFSRGALYHLLRNPIYRGAIRHKGVLHEGGHEAIVKAQLFERVQAKLDAQANRRRQSNSPVNRGKLAGRLFDANGEPMSPTFSHGRKGKTYRYYVSSSLLKGGKPNGDSEIIQRIPANAIETRLTQAAQRLCGSPDAGLTTIERVDLARNRLSFTIRKNQCEGIDARLGEGENCSEDPTSPDQLRITIPLKVRNLRGRTFLEGSSAPRPRIDATLIGALRKAHAMIELDGYNLPTLQKSPDTQHDRRILQLAFLAPDLQARILNGKQPAHLNLEQLTEQPLPISWAEQRKLFAT